MFVDQLYSRTLVTYSIINVTDSLHGRGVRVWFAWFANIVPTYLDTYLLINTSIYKLISSATLKYYNYKFYNAILCVFSLKESS